MSRGISYLIPDAYDEMLRMLSRRWGTTQTQTHLRAKARPGPQGLRKQETT